MSKNNLPKDKTSLKKNEEDSSSLNGTGNSNSSSLENYFGPNGILPLDTSNQSTTVTPSSDSSTNLVDKRLLLQNEDREDNFEELSNVPSEQDKESLDNSSIKDLFENIGENNNFNDVLEEEEKSIVLLGRKRKTKPHDLNPYSSDEE